MKAFLNEIVEWEKFELLIDTQIFSKDIVLKAAFTFLDRWYFFFKLDNDLNIILQFTKRWDNKEDPKNIISDFSDSLLETYLRNKLEEDNKVIRNTIITKAINWPFDQNNFVTLDTDNNEWIDLNNKEENQIDFDKDIDDILKEIENDPELKIDEEEIEKILKEIEEETEDSKTVKPTITINPDAIKMAKEQFKK